MLRMYVFFQFCDSILSILRHGKYTLRRQYLPTLFFPLGWVQTVNQLPIANAGIDQNITDSDNNGSELTTLDGSASSDPDGTIVSYDWSEGGVSIATGVNPQVTLGVGTHTITLTVTDDDGATDTDDVIITVEVPSITCTTTITVGDISSLISAINNANDNSIADTICLEAGTFTLNAVDNSTDGPNGLPSITSEMTLVGLGAGATIQRDTASGVDFRLLHVAAGGDLTVD